MIGRSLGQFFSSFHIVVLLSTGTPVQGEKQPHAWQCRIATGWELCNMKHRVMYSNCFVQARVKHQWSRYWQQFRSCIGYELKRGSCSCREVDRNWECTASYQDGPGWMTVVSSFSPPTTSKNSSWAYESHWCRILWLQGWRWWYSGATGTRTWKERYGRFKTCINQSRKGWWWTLKLTFFPASVVLCLAVRVHLSHRYPNHYCVRHFRGEGVCFRVCFHL